ncbi:hypothetical protein B0H63DRAFT_268719 [Podospora didyma]|uniref:GPI anchored serine-rich protein n=1 Tax=Podospora didyma TaxID=330526 RepID=A0AAE0N9F4_9PEZI|nr:hypothetical protein B0H63DRAFT_268719 [Podospora didyma]
MRFAIATLALAGAAIADSTVYSTDYTTITSCAATVTDCPARSTVVSSSVVALTTSTVYSTSVYTVTKCPDTVSHCPAASTKVVTATVAVGTTVCPVVPTSTPVYSHYTNATGSSIPWYPSSSLTTVAPACPTYSVKTISTQITTVIPTVYYETVSVPCPTPKPSVTAPAANSTTTKGPQPPVTAGASSMSGSLFAAAAVGLAAVALL